MHFRLFPLIVLPPLLFLACEPKPDLRTAVLGKWMEIRQDPVPSTLEILPDGRFVSVDRGRMNATYRFIDDSHILVTRREAGHTFTRMEFGLAVKEGILYLKYPRSRIPGYDGKIEQYKRVR